MGRSLKKGPFVEERLMKRIDAMNAANENEGRKDMVKSFHNFSQKWLDTQSQCMMAESMFLYSSVRTW